MPSPKLWHALAAAAFVFVLAGKIAAGPLRLVNPPSPRERVADSVLLLRTDEQQESFIGAFRRDGAFTRPSYIFRTQDRRQSLDGEEVISELERRQTTAGTNTKPSEVSQFNNKMQQTAPSQYGQSKKVASPSQPDQYGQGKTVASPTQPDQYGQKKQMTQQDQYGNNKMMPLNTTTTTPNSKDNGNGVYNGDSFCTYVNNLNDVASAPTNFQQPQWKGYSDRQVDDTFNKKCYSYTNANYDSQYHTANPPRFKQKDYDGNYPYTVQTVATARRVPGTNDQFVGSCEILQVKNEQWYNPNPPSVNLTQYQNNPLGNGKLSHQFIGSIGGKADGTHGRCKG